MSKTRKKHYYKPSSKKTNSSFIPKIIIAIVVIAMIIVIVTIVMLLTFNKEDNTKSKIENLATSYYEDHLYTKFLAPDGNTNAFEKYGKTGLPLVQLRQLVFTSNLEKSEIERIRKACDENKTYVKYYPEPPYTKTSYHIEYTYNCNF